MSRALSEPDETTLTISPDVRLARLERRTVEMEWVVYGLLGLFLVLFLIRR